MLKNTQGRLLTPMPRQVVPALRWTQGSKYVYANIKCAPDFDESTIPAPCEVGQVSLETKGLLVTAVATESLDSSEQVGVPKLVTKHLPQGTQFLLNFRLWGKIEVNESSWKRDKSGTGLSLKLRKVVRGETWSSFAEAESPAAGTDRGIYPTSSGPVHLQWPQHIEVWQDMQTKLEEAREKSRARRSQEQSQHGQPGSRKTAGAAGGRKVHDSEAENVDESSIWETEGLKQQFENLAAEHEMTANGKKLGVHELLDILRGWMPWRWDWGEEDFSGDDAWSEDDQNYANADSHAGEIDAEHYAKSWERRGSRRRISSARRRRLTEKSTDVAKGAEQLVGGRSIVVVVAVVIFAAMLVASRRSRRSL